MNLVEGVTPRRRIPAELLVNVLFVVSLAALSVCVGALVGNWWVSGLAGSLGGLVVAFAAARNAPQGAAEGSPAAVSRRVPAGRAVPPAA